MLFRFAVIAKIAPYLAAHRDSSLPTNGTRNRLAAPVTQTPSTAVPLCVMHFERDLTFQIHDNSINICTFAI
jgi:hypothetical protein